MKTSRAQMKKVMQTYINSMSDEELAKKLEDTGLSFYKNFKVSIFSHLPDYEEEETVSAEKEDCEKSKTLFGWKVTNLLFWV